MDLCDTIDGVGQRWHLDRRVPIALILAILLQTATGIWWAASISNRTAQLEARADRLDRHDEQLQVLSASSAQRLAGIEAKLDMLLRSVALVMPPGGGAGR